MKLLIALLFTLNFSSAFSQTIYSQARASGYVINGYGQPFHGISVCLQGPYNLPVYPQLKCSYTNYNGFYAIPYLWNGNYVISAQGYGIYYSQNVYVFANSVFNFVF